MTQPSFPTVAFHHDFVLRDLCKDFVSEGAKLQ